MNTTPTTLDRKTLEQRLTILTGDAAHGLRFLQYFGDDVRYCVKRKQWLIWNLDRHRWEWDETLAIDRLAESLIDILWAEVRDIEARQANDLPPPSALANMKVAELRKLADRFNIQLTTPEGMQRLSAKEARQQLRDQLYGEDGKRAAQLAAHARKLGDNRAREQMLTAASKYVVIDPDDVDADPWLLGTQNGVLNLETGEHTTTPDKSLYITKSAGVEWHEGAECPEWTEFIRWATGGDDELARYLQKIAGLALLGKQVVQAFWVLEGIGGNGKTTFIEALHRLLGDYSVATDVKTFLRQPAGTIRNDLARLQGVRLVITSEPDEGAQFDVETMKKAVGGDKLTGRFLHQEYFDFTPQFVLLMAANSAPAITDVGHGIWRRAKRIPFRQRLPEAQQRERYWDYLIDAEGPGILNWALDGLHAYLEEGLNDPEAVAQSSQQYRFTEDRLWRFLDECVEITDNADDTCPKALLYEVFCNWCRNNGERPWSAKVLTKRLHARIEEQGYKHVTEAKSNGKRIWRGLKLADNARQNGHLPPF